IVLARPQQPVHSIGRAVIDALVIERLQHHEKVELDRGPVFRKHKRNRFMNSVRIRRGFALGDSGLERGMMAAEERAFHGGLIANYPGGQNMTAKLNHDFPFAGTGPESRTKSKRHSIRLRLFSEFHPSFFQNTKLGHNYMHI
ncbi:MAG: hypothetical protein WA602_07785, partial [Silvibacterium sp.]